jgi:hypothetical protein
VSIGFGGFAGIIPTPQVAVNGANYTGIFDPRRHARFEVLGDPSTAHSTIAKSIRFQDYFAIPRNRN